MFWVAWRSPAGVAQTPGLLTRPETSSQPSPPETRPQSNEQRILKGLLSWVCGWTRAWRAGFGTRGCGLRALCRGDPPLPAEVSGGRR